VCAVSSLEIPIPRPAPWRVSRWIKSKVEVLMYWSAIVLPMLYLSLLLTRIQTARKFHLFLALVGLHIVALVVGRSHRRPGGR